MAAPAAGPYLGDETRRGAPLDNDIPFPEGVTLRERPQVSARPARTSRARRARAARGRHAAASHRRHTTRRPARRHRRR